MASHKRQSSRATGWKREVKESFSTKWQQGHTVAALSIPPTEFHRFPDLPVELRLMIWSYVFPRCRLIQLRAQGFHTKLPKDVETLSEQHEVKNVRRRLTRQQRAWTPVITFYRLPAQFGPSLLSAVNFEARCFLPKRCTWLVSTAATAIYVPSIETFGATLATRRKHILLKEHCQFWFTKVDLQQDILYFFPNQDMGRFISLIFRCLPNCFFRSAGSLAMCIGQIGWWVPFIGTGKPNILRFRNLKEVHLFYKEWGDDWRIPRRLRPPPTGAPEHNDADFHMKFCRRVLRYWFEKIHRQYPRWNKPLVIMHPTSGHLRRELELLG